ncbi:MAG: ATP-binding protein [Clostridia bacterium]
MTLGSAWKAVRGRLAGRADSEHEQALIRVLTACVLLAYLRDGAFAFWATYFGSALAIVLAVVLWPAPSAARRAAGLVADAGVLTWILIHFGERGAPLFLLYIWITLANGFRFGPRALMGALCVCAAGFALALWQAPFWREHLQMGAVLLVGLVAVSLYVKKLVTRLFEAIEQAQAANQAKRRFISVVSHELRTPLNAIIGMAELLRDTPLNREQADMLQTLRSSSRMMLGLVEEVLDFSKIEAGKVALEKVDFDLHALVNSTCRMLAMQASAKGLEFVVSIMPEVPHALRGDPHYLRQVLVNLAGNALKFTERGSVTVHVALQAEGEGDATLKFSVRDTGIGIPAEAQARIFESFAQADQSTTRRFGGTGLGTTIAKQLVELMGGRIGLESTVGLGSTFWCELPFEKQAARPGGGAGELAGARVLLVGFPPAQAAPLADALGAWGATPVDVPDVDSALARVVSEISVAKPFHSAIVYAAGDLGAAGRFRRGAPEPVPPLVLALPAGAATGRFDALSAGFAAVLELPADKRLLFNVLHSVSAGDEVREGVVRLKDYAARGPASRRLRILAADDNPINRQVLGKILERGGHHVTLVEDGEAALDAFERNAFDLVILDRNMPRLGGIEALQALRVMQRGEPRLPVVVLSADATPEARQEALQAGADAFLAKPIQAMRLLEQVQALTTREGRPPPVAQAAPSPVEREDEAPAVDADALLRLEELGSGPQFMEKLIAVFLADSAALLAKAEQAAARRDAGDLRSLLHALKGSSASMGTERLTQICSAAGALSDGELRLQAPALVRSLAGELAAAREALERYLREHRRSAG